VTPFEDEGAEKIAFYAGGNSLAATSHGENLWVFSLNGTMESLQGEEAEAEGAETAAAPNAEAGSEVFSEQCSVCHGADGLGGNGGPDRTSMPKAKEQKGAEEQVANGGGGMPAFSGTLSEEEIKNVAAYVVETIVGGKK
jgi:alcohol dehydrogenase (cytochrome c)